MPIYLVDDERHDRSAVRRLDRERVT